MLIWNTIFKLVQIDILLVISRFIAHHEYISRKIILNAPNSAYKISEVYIGHLCATTVIAGYEQIIRRKINPFNQCTGAKHRRNLFCFE